MPFVSVWDSRAATSGSGDPLGALRPFAAKETTLCLGVTANTPGVPAVRPSYSGIGGHPTKRQLRLFGSAPQAGAHRRTAEPVSSVGCSQRQAGGWQRQPALLLAWFPRATRGR